MKKKSVCKGCEYYKEHASYTNLRGICDYIEVTGHSRLVVERQNGGYRTDTCLCWKKKERKRRAKNGGLNKA